MEGTIHRFTSAYKILPPRQSRCNIDSVIINQNHIVVFANWIHRRNTRGYISYRFNLLYRASRDVGGYNSLTWHSNTNIEWKSTYDSFIFSFTNKNNLDSARVG
ncbi:BTB/POZ domain-containing protein [Rhizophagus clarus]|uniref:BTB/POZ domain-containing protein n=1 Tax=Rhizophagus clarus TaxID=94130 RepID=A0A8H3R5H5_9GLOM|nr:BTB/POZ domain-containing protein [Rhizophagus clarus]